MIVAVRCDKKNCIYNENGYCTADIIWITETGKCDIDEEEKTRWIPVSERLPESDGCYLVTEKSNRVCTYVFREDGNSEEYWKRCIKAWISLPEPYKPESEG